MDEIVLEKYFGKLEDVFENSTCFSVYLSVTCCSFDRNTNSGKIDKNTFSSKTNVLDP